MFSLVNFWDHNKNICLGPPILPLPKKKFIGYFWPLVSYILKLSIQPYIDQTLNPLALTIHPSTHRRNWLYKPFWKNPTGHPSHLCWNPGWTNPAGWSCWNDLATPKKLKVELFFSRKNWTLLFLWNCQLIQPYNKKQIHQTYEKFSIIEFWEWTFFHMK